MEMRLNICQFGKLLKANVVFEMFMKAMMTSASFSLTCPFKPMQATISDMRIPSSFPIPAPKGFLCVIIEVFAKTNGSKRIEKVGNFESHVILK